MKEYVYLLLGFALIMLIAGGLMYGTEDLENATGDGNISQATLADWLSETPTPTIVPIDGTPPPDDPGPAPGEEVED
jgi:hypothetical protein